MTQQSWYFTWCKY